MTSFVICFYTLFSPLLPRSFWETFLHSRESINKSNRKKFVPRLSTNVFVLVVNKKHVGYTVIQDKKELFEVGSSLTNRVGNQELIWHKQMQTRPETSPDIDLTLDAGRLYAAIEQLNFAQLKGTTPLMLFVFLLKMPSDRWFLDLKSINPNFVVRRVNDGAYELTYVQVHNLRTHVGIIVVHKEWKKAMKENW